MKSKKVLLSLGSNISPRKERIMSCIKLIKNTDNIYLIGSSSLYETSPMYNFDQKKFINCVVEIETTIEPHTLLKVTQSLEFELGRTKNSKRNQPRKIDIDILLYGEESIESEALRIPHLGIFDRKFVLVPIFELKGNISMPGSGKKIKDLITDLRKKCDKIRKCKYNINEKDISYSC